MSYDIQCTSSPIKPGRVPSSFPHSVCALPPSLRLPWNMSHPLDPVHPLPQQSHPHPIESPATDRPSIDAPLPAHLSSTSIPSRVSTRVSSSRTYIACPRRVVPSPTHPLLHPPALGVADDLEKGLPRHPHPHRQPSSQEEGLFPLRKTLVIVTASVALFTSTLSTR